MTGRGKYWQHLHLHFIVAAGGLTEDGRWVQPRYKGKFMFPVRALSQVFRGKFIEALKNANACGRLVLPPGLKHLNHADQFENFVDAISQSAGLGHIVTSKGYSGIIDSICFYMLSCAQRPVTLRLKSILAADIHPHRADEDKNLKYSRIAVIIMGDLKLIFYASRGTFNHRLEDRVGLNLTRR